jgi:hypothetical protein
MLSHRLEEAGVVGHATVERARSVVRPLLLGAVATVGIVWLVSALRRPSRRAFVRPEPSRPSVVNEVIRAASLSLATLAARRIARHLFAQHEAAQPTPAGQLVPPRD